MARRRDPENDGAMPGEDTTGNRGNIQQQNDFYLPGERVPGGGEPDPNSGAFGRSGETPRERITGEIPPSQPQVNQRSIVGTPSANPVSNTSPTGVAPRKPDVPMPQSGSSFSAPQPQLSQPPAPFQPMSQPPSSMMTSPMGGSTDQMGGSPDISSGPMLRMNSLFGSMGGLKGGGLGVPLDPMSNQKDDPISQLIAMLGQRQNA